MLRLRMMFAIVLLSCICGFVVTEQGASQSEEFEALVNCGIFVSAAGVDSPSCGFSPGDPCATISHAITRAVEESETCVFVQAGFYPEVVTMLSGVHVLGGYDLNWELDDYTAPGHGVTIQGGLHGPSTQYMTIRAVGLTMPTQISNLTITGPIVPLNVFGKSSYAVYAQNSNRLSLSNVKIVAGSGANGTQGTPGSAQPNGQIGQSGANGLAVGCDDTTRGAGGSPGFNTCSATNVRGGGGGLGGTANTNCPFNLSPTAGLGGAPGLGPAPGNAGLGGGGCQGGGAGQNGGSGSNGSGGPGAPANPGSVVAGLWSGASGGTGGAGTFGSGGGGGGGAGGCGSGGSFYGAGGGGGGAGACGGTAGSGGTAGGGSFGVFAVSSTLQLANLEIVRGNGGNGGAGGAGGRGGLGGPGGLGGQTGSGAFAGDGGDGGNGGHGGGGGGGAGGISAAVYCSSSTIFQSGFIFSGGAGGTGGSGGPPAPGGHFPPGNAGTPGANGVLVGIQSCGGTTSVAIGACDATPCVTPRPTCVADIAPPGGDGAVGVPDLLAVINAWGPCIACPADIAPPGGDGSVGVPDLLAIINAWGPCP